MGLSKHTNENEKLQNLKVSAKKNPKFEDDQFSDFEDQS